MVESKPIHICAVTGSRADWGLLSSLLKLLDDDDAFKLEVIVTGQHLSSGSRESLAAIETSGLMIADQVDIQLSSDQDVAICKTMGLAQILFSDALARLNPDWLLVLGDRYEIFSAVSVAHILRIPVIHLCGGDITEGAIDDAFRHSITKMSHLHFVTNDDAANRVAQLGESPENIHCVGSTGLDLIRTTIPLDRDSFYSKIGLIPREKNVIVTYHPETLASDSVSGVDELLDALGTFGDDVGVIFTGTNLDTDASSITSKINRFITNRSNAVSHASLGSLGYFSALSHVDAVVGNSSSGLYEAPSFGVPTVNIGNRQSGRIRASSVIDTVCNKEEIIAAIKRALTVGRSAPNNPYGDGHASERILGILKKCGKPKQLLQKHFHKIGERS